MKKLLLAVAAVALLASCCKKAEETTLSGLVRTNFQSEVNGKQTDLYVLKNASGMEVCLTNYGARIVSIMVPDKAGVMQDVVLGFDSISDYVNIDNNFGATIGRYGNRINQGKIVIDGDSIQLPQNNYGHCLHGGPNGWDRQVFDAKQIDDKSVAFTIVSPDGDANFPGNVTATVTMVLTDDNGLELNYEATTDKKTILNLTNHSYFNLSGNPAVSANDQTLYINADTFTPVDSTFMTTGEILDVTGTPMDFRTPKVIGAEIDVEYEQLKNGKGYDHNWVLNTAGDASKVACKLVSPLTGIVMEVFTNEPGVQFYAGNFLDGTVKGKKGIVYGFRSATCLETQHYPDSPNKPEWPSVVVEPGQTYKSQCIYKFSVEK